MNHPNGLSYGARGDKKVMNIGTELAFGTDENVNGIAGGVSVAWLVKAFRMGRSTIEKKLIGCPVIGYGKHRVPLYDLPTCASYLVKPSEQEISRVLSQLDPKDLPEKLREAFWNAKLKEQRYMERAGELWHTDDVIDQIAGLLSTVKAMLTLIPDDLERDAGLKPEQRVVAKAKIDEVQNSIYKMIMKMHEKSQTPNQAVSFQEEQEALAAQRDEIWDFI